MIISEISREDLEAAREVASDALGNRLVFWEFESTSKLRHRVCLQVADIDGPGARRHSHLFYLGYGSWPRRSWFACGHAYGALFTAVYERNPHAKIQTAFATYHHAREFLNTYQSVLDRNVGSLMLPIRNGDECTCEPDYIETDTIPTVILVRNGPVNTACLTLIEKSSGCEDDQAALQGAENRSCLAQLMRSGAVGL